MCIDLNVFSSLLCDTMARTETKILFTFAQNPNFISFLIVDVAVAVVCLLLFSLSLSAAASAAVASYYYYFFSLNILSVFVFFIFDSVGGGSRV